MKCKDCYARNGEDICLIGKKSRMLVCGHYGCDLQARVVERKMGIKKPFTNADRIRAMTDEELAQFLDSWEMGDVDYSRTFCDLCKWQYDCFNDCLMEWLKQEVQE